MSLDEHRDANEMDGGLGNQVGFPGFTVSDANHNDNTKKIKTIKYKLKYKNNAGITKWSGTPAGSEISVTPNASSPNTWIGNPDTMAGQVIELTVNITSENNSTASADVAADTNTAASAATFAVQPNQSMTPSVTWSPWTT